MEAGEVSVLAEDGKENAVPSKRGTGASFSQATPHAQFAPQHNRQITAKDCPQTPIGRLPLAELIASGEDLNHVLNLTPVERVLWGNSARTADQRSSQETPALPSSRKRAHSSSPASSSQKTKVSKHSAADEVPAKMHHARQALKTPQGDPASDLWNRYSLNIDSNEKQSPTKINGRLFSQLMNSSSPQTPAQALSGRETTGLRRSFSCGTEWPTSAAKRRKLQHSSHQEHPVGLAISDEPVVRSQKWRSRLSLLVDKIHDGLAKPPADKMHYSPTPAVRFSQSMEDRSIHNNLVSPGQSAQQEAKVNSGLPTIRNEFDAETGVAVPRAEHKRAMQDYQSDIHTHRPAPEDQHQHNSNGGEADSDFGDDDLDLEMFEAINAPVAFAQPMEERPQKPAIGMGKPRSQVPPERDQAIASNGVEPILSRKERLPAPLPGQLAAFRMEQDNEFDDDANDVSAEDLEDAIALFDSQQNGRHKVKPILQNKQAVRAPCSENVAYVSKFEESDRSLDTNLENLVENPSDDEFGGDVEFEEVIAECDGAMSRQPIIDQGQSTVCFETNSTTKPAKKRKRDRKDSTIQRFVIMTVAEGEYLTSSGQSRPEKVD